MPSLPHNFRHNLPIALSVLLVMVVAGWWATRPGAADAEPHHRRVRQAVDEMPDRIGPWIGRDQPMPDASIDLLNPNAMRARTFTHAATGRQVAILVVHCRNIRDIAGHYPPRCYPATGWVQQDARPVRWQARSGTMPAMRYRFQRRQDERQAEMVVDSALFLPEGAVRRRLEALWEQAGDYQTRFYGAAQLQILTPADMKPETRRRTIRRLLTHHEHVLEALQSSSR
jgi:hypothetical protein